MYCAVLIPHHSITRSRGSCSPQASHILPVTQIQALYPMHLSPCCSTAATQLTPLSIVTFLWQPPHPSLKHYSSSHSMFCHLCVLHACAAACLCGGCDDILGETVVLLHAIWEPVAAVLACIILVVRPKARVSRACNIWPLTVGRHIEVLVSLCDDQFPTTSCALMLVRMHKCLSQCATHMPADPNMHCTV